jgi:hypothetical protein
MKTEEVKFLAFLIFLARFERDVINKGKVSPFL